MVCKFIVGLLLLVGTAGIKFLIYTFLFENLNNTQRNYTKVAKFVIRSDFDDNIMTS